MISPLSTFLGRLRCLAAREGLGELSDGRLLELFVARRDQEAFSVLVWRHGHGVWKVCRGLVRTAEDADDAFQATFLTLVRRARGIRRPETVGAWLRKVAIRVALDARKKEAKRAHRERHHEHWAEVPAAPQPAAVPEMGSVLVEEIARLPEQFRSATLVCYLEGKSVQEAADLLHCPRGTILSRLARARHRLRRRLSHRGLAVSPGVLVLALGDRAAVPPLRSTLVDAVMRAACASDLTSAATSGLVASNIVALSEGVLKGMFLTKLKVSAAIVLGVCLLGGSALLRYHAQAGPSPELAANEAWPEEQRASPAQPVAAQPADHAQAPKKFDNAPAWHWFIPPSSPATRQKAEKAMIYLLDRDADGAQIVYLAFTSIFDRNNPQYRVVLFDAEGNRFVAEVDRGGSSNKLGQKISLVRFRLDPKQLRQEKVTEIGVEGR